MHFQKKKKIDGKHVAMFELRKMLSEVGFEESGRTLS
jgi:hypothetical protein